MYPYKIAEYRYKLLTEPCEIGELNYLRSEELRDQSVSRSVNCSFVSSGRCDAVVVWSDYSINESGALSVLCCENKVFAYHAKVSIKFFSAPVEIETISEHDLHVDTTFIYGASDFSYNFLVK